MDTPPADLLDSWPAHLATAAATGLVTAYLPIQRWSPAARWTLHGGMGALAATGMAIALRRGVKGDGPDARREPVAPLPTAGIALGLGALVVTASRGGQAADEWAERALATRGVRRPRLWLGALAAGASLAMSVADSRRDAAREAARQHADGPEGSAPGTGS